MYILLKRKNDMQKRNNIKLSLVLLIIGFTIISCDKGDCRLTLINNTSDTIYFELNGEDSIVSYPMQFIGDSVFYSWEILPFNKYSQCIVGNWEDHINSGEDKTIRVYFFINQLIKNTNKDSLLKYQMYSKKIELKVDELKKQNWEVIYE
jgi:hypothetical protein